MTDRTGPVSSMNHTQQEILVACSCFGVPLLIAAVICAGLLYKFIRWAFL